MMNERDGLAELDGRTGGRLRESRDQLVSESARRLLRALQTSMSGRHRMFDAVGCGLGLGAAGAIAPFRQEAAQGWGNVRVRLGERTKGRLGLLQ